MEYVPAFEFTHMKYKTPLNCRILNLRACSVGDIAYRARVIVSDYMYIGCHLPHKLSLGVAHDLDC